MMKNGDLSFALIVDGETLANIVEADLNETFKEIALKCDSVLCCRMSPSQKAYVR
jgi:magnesium-transporting ATPase (P-type)